MTLRLHVEVWDDTEPGGFRVVDFKGVLTREFRLKLKLWKAVYPAVPFCMVQADGEEVRR